MIPTLIIDSTNCPTELCMIGAEFKTDKSPFELVNDTFIDGYFDDEQKKNTNNEKKIKKDVLKLSALK